MGFTRDAYYKHWCRKSVKKARDEKVIELVKEIRQDQPRVGCRKLHEDVKEQLADGHCMGRDKFFEILGEHGMHVKPRKKRYTKTTYSKHQYAVAPNRLKNTEVNRPNQVFVADITYVSLSRSFAYLFLVTDLFSRKIVGWHLSKTLDHQNAVTALSMALGEVPDSNGLIHHSDRGCQYCCHDFLTYLGENGVVPSMTDESHCYQNAVAERVNGILKQEFYIDTVFTNLTQATRAVADAIRIYNTKRRHFSLKLKTPQEIYLKAA